MNDVEHELRELFEEKARDARIAPAPPVALLKRGRRRQVGTAAIGAATALLVIVASVFVLRTVGSNRPTTPGSNDLGERTATIQNFTVTAPAGWTLIDWWPIARNLLTPDTASAGTTPSPSGVSPADVVPVLQVSNFDPGLDGTQGCRSGSQLGPDDAELYVVFDAASTRSHGTLGPLWPVQMDGSGAPTDGPCGSGYYARFRIGGEEYVAFVGLGSAVAADVRSQAFGIFGSMRSTGSVSTASGDGFPAYVMASGAEGGLVWQLELGLAPPVPSTSSAPPSAWLSVSTGLSQQARWQLTGEPGAADAIVVQVGSLGVVAGAVAPDAVRVDYRAPDGTTFPVSVVGVPDSLLSSISGGGGAAPDRIFWMVGEVSPDGRVLQTLSDGSQQVDPIGVFQPNPSTGDEAVQSDLRNALVAALTYYTDGATFVGFTPKVAASIEPSLTYNSSSTVVGEISVRDVTGSTVLLVAASGTGGVRCIANDQATGTTSYGTVDAQTAAQCVGGEAAWGIGSLQSPQPTHTPKMDTIGTGQALGDTWTLKASLNPSYCTDLDFGNQSWDGCAISQPVERVGPDPDRPSSEYFQIVPGGALYVESVPTVVESMEVRAASGAVFTGSCLAAPTAYGPVRYCVIGLEGEGKGTVHFLAADGSEAFPSYAIDWSRQTAAGSPTP